MKTCVERKKGLSRYYSLRFKAVTPESLNSAGFWDAEPCSLVGIDRSMTTASAMKVIAAASIIAWTRKGGVSKNYVTDV
jgi:hypothetical protein